MGHEVLRVQTVTIASVSDFLGKGGCRKVCCSEGKGLSLWTFSTIED